MAWEPQVIRFTDLEVRHDRTVIDRLFFNSRFRNLADSLNRVSSKISELDVVEQDFVALALERLDTSLGPLMETLQQASELGFLVGQSASLSVSLASTAPADFQITSAGRALFTPPKFLLAIDDGDSTNCGIVEVILYTPSTGDLATTCRYASKTQASTSWTISANAAVLPVMVDLVNDAEADAATATAAVATLADNMVTIQNLIDTLEAIEGPVTTVNGMVGPAIVIGIANIANLQSSLDAKATTAALNTGLG